MNKIIKENTEAVSNLEPLLKIKDMSLSFIQYGKALQQQQIKVISNLSLEVYRGEITAVVGSSGSGKSLLAHAILGILPSNAVLTGEMKYNSLPLTQQRKENIRGNKIALIPQSTTYLDPLMKIENQVIGSVDKKNKELKQKRFKNIFQKYGLYSIAEKMFPHELSGGMTRRVLVSTVLMQSPDLIIADEPTPGLDENNLNETLNHFKEMADDGRTVILITHDIEAALRISHRIAIFYAGTILEIANKKDFSNGGEKLRHPYTRALWNALPQNEFISIEGQQPLQDELEDRCVFYDRCSKRTEKCEMGLPIFQKINNGFVRCKNVSES